MDALLARSWKTYRTLSKAPPETRPLRDAILPLIGSARLVQEFVQEHEDDMSPEESRDLAGLMEAGIVVIARLEALLAARGMGAERGRRFPVRGVGDAQTLLRGLNARMEGFLEGQRRWVD